MQNGECRSLGFKEKVEWLEATLYCADHVKKAQKLAGLAKALGFEARRVGEVAGKPGWYWVQGPVTGKGPEPETETVEEKAAEVVVSKEGA